MKIFVSWSGERSRRVAELLREWIPDVIQAVELWVSSEDIDRGKMWFSEINNALAEMQSGIICLTQSNKEKPWILFESGALAKGLGNNRIFTFLIDLKNSDIKDPLGQFNHTSARKNDMKKLIFSINSVLERIALDSERLTKSFDLHWPKFEDAFAQILAETVSEEVKNDIPTEQKIDQILNSVRIIERQGRKSSTSKNSSFHLDEIDLIDLAITKREEEILRLIPQGLLAKEIADQLHIAVNTVEIHKTNLMRKTGSRNVQDLTRYAILNGYYLEE